MIISCSSCGAKYLVDPAQINKGRQVRCARCNFSWFQDSVGVAESGFEVDSKKIIAKRDQQSDKNLPAVYKEKKNFINDNIAILILLLFIGISLGVDYFNRIDPLEILYLKSIFIEILQKVFLPK
ncbi:zinc-ribbon domain-containing protein [Pelagibacterales bacterium]|nr:zinc-ribbon domain-containing protein [Pelagibacterales bacterium]